MAYEAAANLCLSPLEDGRAMEGLEDVHFTVYGSKVIQPSAVHPR